MEKLSEHPLKYLVIILSGFTGKAAAYMHIKNKVRDTYPDANVIIPKLGLHLFSAKNPNKVVAHIIDCIDHEWNNDHYDRIIIIGHSCGALLARKVYLYACGENSDAPFELNGYETPRVWAGNIERVILFAGMNRGWIVNMYLSFTMSLIWRIGTIIAYFLSIFRYHAFIMKLHKGAPFISQMRIQWLSMLNKHDKGEKAVGAAIVIQLLGTIDDLVSPDDNVDLITGSSFFYLEVPYSGHKTVLDLDDSKEGKARTIVFLQSLNYNKEQLKALELDSYEQRRIVQNVKVTDVVFVIHGIRDAGYWTRKLASRVQRLGKQKGRFFETETSSYGYFPMLSFLLYPTRRKKVEWLMDQYTENLALYPNANFSFVGHSNGTYLLARALEDYPACRFKNVVFAGSVVRSNYDWNNMIDKGRVGSITNLVASADWVVAIFPKAFQAVGWQDLGSAGHDGFSVINTGIQVEYLQGSHGVGVKEGLWDTIASYIVDGNDGTVPVTGALPKRNAWVWFLGYIAPLPFLFIIVIVFLIGYEMFSLLTCSLLFQIIFVLIYSTIIWKVVTKF
jgi:hypothetical protein